MVIHRMSEIRALIFDFDGVILDTETPVLLAWQEIYQEYGCRFPVEEWLGSVGGGNYALDPYSYLEHQTGKTVDRSLINTRRSARRCELIAAQSIPPGVPNYLDNARRLGLNIGLASNSSRQWVHDHLLCLGIEHFFDCVKCIDDVSAPKPDPALYQAVLTSFGVQGKDAIAFEDATKGIASAKQAGLFCIAVPLPLMHSYSFGAADLRMRSLADMTFDDLLTGYNNWILANNQIR